MFAICLIGGDILGFCDNFDEAMAFICDELPPGTAYIENDNLVMVGHN